MSSRHSLLARQIRRHFGGEEKIPADFEPFLAAVDAAYRQSDDDRAMLERSMDLSSQELMQTNTALRQSLSLVQATLESTADGLLVVDESGKIVAFNHRFVEMWRLPEELMESRDDERAIAAVLDQLVYPEGFVARVRELYAQPDAESQDVLEFKDSRVFERYSQPQRIGGRSVGRVWSFRDVTERRRAEEERARLQVMGALGHLVGGLAHEVRNPLFAISATLEALVANVGDETVRRALDNLREPTTRLSELMSELLEYGKPLGRMLTAGNLHDLLAQSVADCDSLAQTRGVRLATRLTDGEVEVGMIRRRLGVALTNLIQNAIQHTPRGGEVTIETMRVEDDGGAWVRSLFKDSGAGFKEGDLPQVFNPFFTRRRGGTGLGLSIVQRVVEEHRGRIRAGNRPEGGALLTLDLPPG
ncbi:MAG TPA: ATP-binding protein [Thermoanaerobaculia bacterium]|jgi:PAS domain S-box-containing protein|nr:ATP-binding protein [Thermoanaerobaculia bacterium]